MPSTEPEAKPLLLWVNRLLTSLAAHANVPTLSVNVAPLLTEQRARIAVAGQCRGCDRCRACRR